MIQGMIAQLQGTPTLTFQRKEDMMVAFDSCTHFQLNTSLPFFPSRSWQSEVIASYSHCGDQKPKEAESRQACQMLRFFVFGAAGA